MPSDHPVVADAPGRLASLLDLPLDQLDVKEGVRSAPEMKSSSHPGRETSEIDLLIHAGPQIFVLECKGSGQAASVAMAARHLHRSLSRFKKPVVPVVVVPYMGETGRRLCEDENVSWFDLSGNAQITAPGLRIEIEGKPNRFKRAGRPKSLFAPKSARITRWLLMQNDRAFTQRELAKLSGLNEGFASRIIRGLEDEELIKRSDNGTIRTANYDTLLDAWRETYDFSKHHIVRGHVAARSSDDVIKRLARELPNDQITYAATGLAGAWLYSGFAGFRLAIVYVSKLPGPVARDRLDFQEVGRGENVWLVRPDDDGVFDGAETRHGIACVHPIQVYLDLKDHPERAAQAAEELRKKLLNPSHPPAHV